MAFLPCQHYFCEDCLLPWLKKRCTCPMCRHSIPSAADEEAEEAERAAREGRTTGAGTGAGAGAAGGVNALAAMLGLPAAGRRLTPAEQAKQERLAKEREEMVSNWYL